MCTHIRTRRVKHMHVHTCVYAHYKFGTIRLSTRETNTWTHTHTHTHTHIHTHIHIFTRAHAPTSPFSAVVPISDGTASRCIREAHRSYTPCGFPTSLLSSFPLLLFFLSLFFLIRSPAYQRIVSPGIASPLQTTRLNFLRDRRNPGYEEKNLINNAMTDRLTRSTVPIVTRFPGSIDCFVSISHSPAV